MFSFILSTILIYIEWLFSEDDTYLFYSFLIFETNEFIVPYVRLS